MRRRGKNREATIVVESETRFAAAVCGTDMGLWESGSAGEFVWLDNWYDRFDVDPCPGPDQEQLWRRRVHPEDLAGYSSAAAAAASGLADHYVAEYRILTRSNRWRWLHERGKVTARGANGNAKHFVGVCFCIDNQRKLEAELRAAENRYELAVSAARLPVWEYDVRKDIVTGNTHYHRAVGYELTDEEALQRVETWLSDIHPDDVEQTNTLLARAASDPSGFYDSECRIRLPNGEYKWLLNRARVVERAPDGAPLKVVGISLDIDAHKHLEMHLRENEERFRGAFEFAAIGMALVAPDGRWLRVNRSLCQIVGYAADELLATDFQSITHPEDLDKGVGHLRRVLDESLSHYDIEKRYLHKDGHIVWVLLSVSVVRDDTGEPMYFVSQIQDITERKRLERALQEATHREHQRIGQDVHDGLGQELTGLAYLASSLATEAARADSPLADDLTILSSVARHTIETCRNIARGVSPLTECRGSLVESLRQIAALAAAGGHARVNFESIENAALTLPSESRDQLHRITQEAVNNALTHSDADSIQVTIQIDPTLVQIEVVDNGRGLCSSGVPHSGLGIDGMRQRAATIGARLRVETKLCGGVAVVCECPQPAPERSAP